MSDADRVHRTPAFDVAHRWLPVAGAPRLTQARGELLREIQILDEYGEQPHASRSRPNGR